MINPKTVKAIQKNANGLVEKGTWGLSAVWEQGNVETNGCDHHGNTHIGHL